MSEDATAPDAWQELRAFAEALQDDLIVLPDGVAADGSDAADQPDPGSVPDPWDELRAIAGATAPERNVPPQER